MGGKEISEDNQEPNQEKKKTRRTRKDEQGRNFNCPCGKSYLSYPALYTHIKTKHYGKIPTAGITQSSKQSTLPPVPVVDTSNHPQCLINIKQMLDKNFPNTGVVLTTELSASQENYLEDIMRGNGEDQGQINCENINGILTMFLLEMKKILSAEPYNYLCQLILCLHQQIQEQKKDSEYCLKNSGTSLPYFFNDLISKKKVPTVKYLYQPNSNYLSVACKVLFNFGIWLFENRYSNFSIRYNLL